MKCGLVQILVVTMVLGHTVSMFKWNMRRSRNEVNSVAKQELNTLLEHKYFLASEDGEDVSERTGLFTAKATDKKYVSKYTEILESTVESDASRVLGAL